MIIMMTMIGGSLVVISTREKRQGPPSLQPRGTLANISTRKKGQAPAISRPRRSGVIVTKRKEDENHDQDHNQKDH